MKKAARTIPNQRLREERELRGWSQKYVADQIGADHYYLSRWEHGITVPSPYYRQKLCELFGKNAKELGLLQGQEGTHATQEGPAREPGDSAARSPWGVIHDPTIPLSITEGTGLVGRAELLYQLKERLCSGKGVVLTALGGLPGVGKTTLAAVLAGDRDVLGHFSDGVLWAGLGPAPNVLSLLSRWGMLLGLPAAEATRLTTSEDWAKELHSMIGMRRLLLVIDDAWHIEAALAFKVGGPRCAYLVTTRFPPIALHFASDDAIVVPELAEEDGINLLARFAPEVVASDPVYTRRLVQAVSGLPLALTIMGKYLRKEAYSQQPRRIHAALERLQDTQERLRLSEPRGFLERSPSLPLATPVSLQAVIEVGDRQLEEPARAALYTLSVFPAKPNSFSEAAAGAVGGVSVEVLDELTDAGLLEGSGPGRYTMHQTIADYARANLMDSGAYVRLAEYMAQYVASHQKDDEALEQESSNIFAALQAASREERYRDLIRCMNAFAPFLLARGLFTQAEDYLLQAERAARLLQDKAGLATALLYLGRIQWNRGDYSQAETTLQEGLTLARQNADTEQLCRLLHALGTVGRYQGTYRQAETYHREGLELARQLGDYELMGMLLQGLGIDLGEQGHYDQEEACYREGIALAREIGDQERLCELLLNLGQAVYAKGDYTQSMLYSEQALQLCRQIGYRHAMTTLLANLGNMATQEGNFDQAAQYLQEALEMARQMGHRNLIGVSLINLAEVTWLQGDDAQAELYLQEGAEIARQIGRPWLLCAAFHAEGELALKQHQLERAFNAFREVQRMASGGNQEYLAVALYGLAQVAKARGDTREAREQGQESLRIMEAIKNRKAPEVRAWLEGLPPV
jgi:tetratricopeptide (TPR) repeat protein/transcriptional regulator with XRE-family HTH domain